MRIAIIGADGQLGTDLRTVFPNDDVRPLFWPGFDITRRLAAGRVLAGLDPDLIINTAAFHRVDECEDAADRAFAVNAFAVRDLARLSADLGATFVHFSTDYVFDGRKRRPYVEDDRPGPLSVYAASKLAGEFFVQAYAEKYFLIRTCGLYGTAGCREKGKNFVEAMLALAAGGRGPIRVVADQVVTPTSTAELASRIAELVRTEAYGLYHMTNEGACSWYEFARAIFDLTGQKADLVPVDSAAYGAKARRPAYSVLENARFGRLGISPFSPWPEALERYLKREGRPPEGE
jgi:dTDP-4-dehydrorhamnose reductase